MLIDEIIELLTTDGSLVTALLKTKVLLHTLGRKDLAAWVNNELDGYPPDSDLPDYRILPAQVLANAASPVARATNHPIPIGHLTKSEQDSLTRIKMREGLAAIEAFSGNGLRTPIAMEANGRLGEQLGNGWEIEHAWSSAGDHQVKNLLTTVRSKLLDFLLNVRDEVGDVTTEREIAERGKQIDTGGIFHNAIFGPNATIIVGDNCSPSAPLRQIG